MLDSFPGSYMPKTDWLLYAENRLAPICRKRSGSFMPKTSRLLYAGSPLAPIWRKMTRAESPVLCGDYRRAASGDRGGRPRSLHYSDPTGASRRLVESRRWRTRRAVHDSGFARAAVLRASNGGIRLDDVGARKVREGPAVHIGYDRRRGDRPVAAIHGQSKHGIKMRSPAFTHSTRSKPSRRSYSRFRSPSRSGAVLGSGIGWRAAMDGMRSIRCSTCSA